QLGGGHGVSRDQGARFSRSTTRHASVPRRAGVHRKEIGMSYFTGLQCHVCHTRFPAEGLYVCDSCLGPLEATYDYQAVRAALTPGTIAARPRNIWRYRELLPIEGEPRTGFHSGFTPLVRSDRLARRLGLRELYLKDDSVNHPTFSYKDRVVSV